MSELIITRAIKNLDRIKPMERKAFYEAEVSRAVSGESPELSVDVVDVFLFNEHGELFVQKRSKDKFHNANLLDKSLGGHVQYGDSPEYTVMVETVQELQVPSISVYGAEEFEKTLKTLKKYLSTVAIVKPIDKKLYVLDKIVNGKPLSIANYVHLYFGFYSGRVKTVDREAKGILQYSLDDLYAEMESLPQVFTCDLHTFLEDYKEEFYEFLSVM